MTKEQIIHDVNQVLVDVLGDETIRIGEQTTAQDVPGWDSLAHIQFLLSIEKRFRIKFTSSEVLEFRTVGEMCDSILAKTAQNEKK